MLQEKDYRVNQKLLTIALCIGILFMFFAPFLFTRTTRFQFFDFTHTGEIGDTIGGLTAPFTGLIGAVLVYYSFMAQQKANRLQYDGLMKEIELNKKQSNFKIIYELIQDCKNEFNLKKQVYSNNSLVELLYNNEFTELSSYHYVIFDEICYLSYISGLVLKYDMDNENKILLGIKLKNLMGKTFPTNFYWGIDNMTNDDDEKTAEFGKLYKSVMDSIYSNVKEIKAED